MGHLHWYARHSPFTYPYKPVAIFTFGNTALISRAKWISLLNVRWPEEDASIYFEQSSYLDVMPPLSPWLFYSIISEIKGALQIIIFKRE